MSNSWASQKPVMSKWWASHGPLISQSWASHGQVMIQSWASHEKVMKQSLNSHETRQRSSWRCWHGCSCQWRRCTHSCWSPTPHSIKNITNSLKRIYLKKIIGRKRNERWELPCSLQSGSSWLLHWWHAQQHWCARTTSPSCQQTQSSCTWKEECSWR